MRYLYQEKNRNDIFVFEDGDAEILFPLYAKEPLIFCWNQPIAKEAILAQRELNDKAKDAYLQHLFENGKDMESEEAQCKLHQIEAPLRALSFYMSGRLEDAINYEWISGDSINISVTFAKQKSPANFP